MNALGSGTSRPASEVAEMPERLAREQQLVHSCQGLVRSLAWKIKQKLPPAVELEDLIAYGQLGLLQAARNFDPVRGGQFTTFAYHRVRGAILDGLSQMAWFSPADYHRSRYERLGAEVLQADSEDAQSAEAGAPSIAEDAGWLAAVAAKLSIVYLGSALGAEAASRAEDERQSPPARLVAGEMRENLLRVIASLPSEAQSLIRFTYFDGFTLTEAGRQLGMSKAWASRLHARTVAQLARSMRRLEPLELERQDALSRDGQ